MMKNVIGILRVQSKTEFHVKHSVFPVRPCTNCNAKAQQHLGAYYGGGYRWEGGVVWWSCHNLKVGGGRCGTQSSCEVTPAALYQPPLCTDVANCVLNSALQEKMHCSAHTGPFHGIGSLE